MAFEFLDNDSAAEIAENLKRVKSSAVHQVTYRNSAGSRRYSQLTVADGEQIWVSDTADIPYFLHWSLTPHGEPYSGLLTVDDSITIWAVCDDTCTITLDFPGHKMVIDGKEYTDTYTTDWRIDVPYEIYAHAPEVSDTEIFCGWVQDDMIDNYYVTYPADKTNTYTARIIPKKDKVTVHYSTGSTTWADDTTDDKVIEYDNGYTYSDSKALCEAPTPPDGCTVDDFQGWRLNSTDGAVIYIDVNTMYEDCTAIPIWHYKDVPSTGGN